MAATNKGRPKKAVKSKQVKFSVPKGLYDYLQLLADKDFSAATPNEMARVILIERAETLRKERYLGVRYLEELASD